MWLCTGAFAALGVMAKYYTLALIASLAIMFLIDKDTRAQLKTRAPYFGLLVFLVIIAPHFIWLFHHDFITVKYVFFRTNAIPALINHLYFPWQFLWQQFEAFAPTLLLFAFLFIGKRPLLAPEKIKPTTQQHQFLFLAAWMPLLLTLLLSLVTGARLRAGWGVPLLSFIPLYLFMITQPRISTSKLTVFTTGIFAFLITLWLAYASSIIDSRTESTANYPGKEIARVMTSNWYTQYHTPLKYVAGSRWVGGNISFYSKERPAVYIEWNAGRAPWIDEADLRKNGAVFVWDINDHETLPDTVKQRFPTLLPETVMTFNYDRNKRHIPPIQIGVAILPPEKIH